jgi:hypothetical protein
MPFAFALLRAARTSGDFRYLWVAIAASLCVAATLILGKARGRTFAAASALSASAWLVATLATGLVSSRLGWGSGPGMWIVVAAFSLCGASGYVLQRLLRR